MSEESDTEVVQNRRTRHFPHGAPNPGQCPNCGYFKTRKVVEVDFYYIRRIRWLPIFTKLEKEEKREFAYCLECGNEFNERPR